MEIIANTSELEPAEPDDVQFTDRQFVDACRLTDAAVRNLHRIANGVPRRGDMAAVAAFSRLAEIGHREVAGRDPVKRDASPVYIVVQPPPRLAAPEGLSPLEDSASPAGQPRPAGLVVRADVAALRLAASPVQRRLGPAPSGPGWAPGTSEPPPGRSQNRT